jgi:hypothetical protein
VRGSFWFRALKLSLLSRASFRCVAASYLALKAGRQFNNDVLQRSFGLFRAIRLISSIRWGMGCERGKAAQCNQIPWGLLKYIHMNETLVDDQILVVGITLSACGLTLTRVNQSTSSREASTIRLVISCCTQSSILCAVSPTSFAYVSLTKKRLVCATTSSMPSM